MKRIHLVVLLAFLVIAPVTSTAGSPGQWYLPTIQINQYRWPERGFGHPPEAWSISHEALIGERPVWFYDWWWGCARWAQDGGVYIPSVMRAWYPEVMACNDGRPLLVLNEPEEAGQADLTPEQAAGVLHAAVTSGGVGPIFCCGTQAAHLPYMRQLVAAYQSAYGVWPADGLHVHIYHGVAELDAFMQWAIDEGILGDGIVVSEFGYLTDDPISVAQMESLIAELETRPQVLTHAWFSAHYEPWQSSNLLDVNGALTELGQAWID